MSLVSSIIEFPRKVRLADVIVVVALGGLIYWLAVISREWGANTQSVTQIHTELSYLPAYIVYSLTRGLVAYGISLLFTIFYGYTMAHSKRAERVLLPLLDILQSIPVLSFLPAFSIALIALFPNSNIGLELVAVLAIFTGQVWNMTYAFYRSLRAIPSDMRDAAESFYLSKREILTKVELPASAIPLIWNSMMSMAGGWFFLTVCEAFTLGKRDFRLPGVGSYMSVAIERGDTTAMIGAVVAMAVMIIFLDRVLWRPLIIWSRKFRMEDTAEEYDESSVVLDIVQGSKLVEWVFDKLRAKEERKSTRSGAKELALVKVSTTKILSVVTVREPVVRKIIIWTLIIIVSALVTYGAAAAIVTLASTLSFDELQEIGIGTGATFLRVLVAIGLSVLWTVPAGIFIGMNRTLSKRLQPVVQFFASFPAPMIFPLILLGMNRFNISIEIGAVLMMMLGTQWYMLFNVMAGASAIPHDLQELGDTFSVKSSLRWKKIILPAIFPSLVTGMITAAGGAWNASIVAENYVVPGKERMTATGIGAMISFASEKNNIPMLIASTIALCLVVVCINKFVWRRLFSLAQERFTLNK